MERNLWVSTLIISLHLTLYIAAAKRPGNVNVHIWEGNVTITWDHPQENPGDYLYQVQLRSYPDSGEVWSSVPHCNLLKTTVCNIGNLPVDSDYTVRVGAFLPQNNITWSIKRQINIRRSQLLAPTFTLSSTSYAVQVKIYRKKILNKIFTNGVKYTTYLWPAGQKNQTLTKSYDDDDEDNDDTESEITFTSLHPLQEYCVFVKVESIASDASNTSLVHCITLQIDWTLVICLILLGLLGLMGILMVCICFLRRPQKMPSALKLVVSMWMPMAIELVEVETVTEKGWFIINNPDTKKSIEFVEEDIERRGSLDSGVSIEQLQLLSTSNTKAEIQNGDVQVDSGCESLEGTEGSGSVRRTTGQFSINEIHCSGTNEGREDSGLGLGRHEGSGSLEGEDTGLLSNVMVGDGYRSQSPSSVDALNDMDSNIAAPSAGYRSGQVNCMCSAHEYCIWCKSKNTFTDDCQTVTQSQTDSKQINDGNSVSSSYSKNSLIQTVCILNMEDPMTKPVMSDNNCADSLICPLLLQNEQKQDGIMDMGAFTLDNMELTFSSTVCW